MNSTSAEDIYRKLLDEEDARICSDISEAACVETPGNFLKILVSNFFTKIGDAIASPKTVLAWVTTAVGAPAAFLGFLVPIRESGSLIPQLVIASYVRGLAVRKYVWVVGSVVQALAIGGLGLVAVTLRGAAAGWAIIALLVVFSLARGFCSVAAKDVLGKTIPKTRRGRLNGWSASAAGLVTLGVGVTLVFYGLQRQDDQAFGWLLAIAACMWLLGAVVYLRVAELPGETAGGGNAVSQALSRLGILKSDAGFRRFVIARSLLMCSALSAPFYVALGQQAAGSATGLLGLFVVADGLASLVSAPVWGHFADRSSKRVMAVAALITAGTGLLVVAANLLAPGIVASYWFMPCAYFALSLAHAGVRVGRKTYIVDLAEGNRRTDYVAVSNTVIGVLLLAVGAIGSVAASASVPLVIALLSAMGLAGAVLSAFLADTAG